MSRRRLPLSALPWLTTMSLVLVLCSAPAVPADPNPAANSAALDKRVLDEAKVGSEIMVNLTQLSDEIGPRLTGSAALKRANEWAAEKMRAYGLTDVHLEGWTIPVGWERGSAAVRIVEPNNGRLLTVAAMGWTPGTNGKVVGDVMFVNAKSSKDLEPYKGKLKGAVVLSGAPATIRPVAEKGFVWTPDGQPPKSGERDSKKEPLPEAKPNGKLDAKPKITSDAPPGFGPDMERRFEQMRSFRKEMREFLRNEGASVLLMDAGKPHGLLTTTGAWQGEDRVSGAEPLPTLFMAHEHYAQLHRLVTRPGGAKTRVEVEVSNKFVPGPIPVYNTVGEIRGAEKPEEIVVLGAHLDSWDLGQGTTDNGTGSCVVLEAARILNKSGVRPKRTIRFVLFSGEEQGLYGSKAYVKQHEAELPKTSMALVHDTGTGKVIGIGLQGRAAIKPILEGELAGLKELGLAEISLRGMGGTDHASFEKAGVPGFAVQQDPAEYRLSHHSQSDTLDKAREPDLVQGAQVMAVTALRVANLPNLLPRDKPAPERPRPATEEKPKAEEKAVKEPVEK